VLTADYWVEGSKPEDRPSLSFKLEKHIEKLGAPREFGQSEEKWNHTWYLIECSMTLKPTGEVVSWIAPRRLVQLRVGLHDVLKELLDAPSSRKSGSYSEHFGKTPFASHGGWRGNGEKSFPALLALTLSFLKVDALFPDPIPAKPLFVPPVDNGGGYSQDVPPQFGTSADEVSPGRISILEQLLQQSNQAADK